jgi:hypothetical protein
MGEEMSQPYSHIRFKWWWGADLKEVADELGKEYTVTAVTAKKEGVEISLYKDQRDELKVAADTLTALISPFRAVLSQKERAPFTERDMALRKKIFELYPRDRPTPFPWEWSIEPKFEVAKKAK